VQGSKFSTVLREPLAHALARCGVEERARLRPRCGQAIPLGHLERPIDRLVEQCGFSLLAPRRVVGELALGLGGLSREIAASSP